MIGAMKNNNINQISSTDNERDLLIPLLDGIPSITVQGETLSNDFNRCDNFWLRFFG
jgi:hypothetical protein